MATIQEAQAQAQLRQEQIAQQEGKISQYEQSIPQVTQQQLRGQTLGQKVISPLKALMQRRAYKKAQEKAAQERQKLEQYKQEVSQYQEGVQSYLSTEAGKLQYAKEQGLQGQPIYGKIGKGYAEELLGYTYQTPYGTVTDWTPKQQALQREGQYVSKATPEELQTYFSPEIQSALSSSGAEYQTDEQGNIVLSSIPEGLKGISFSTLFGRQDISFQPTSMNEKAQLDQTFQDIEETQPDLLSQISPSQEVVKPFVGPMPLMSRVGAGEFGGLEVQPAPEKGTLDKISNLASNIVYKVTKRTPTETFRFVTGSKKDISEPLTLTSAASDIGRAAIGFGTIPIEGAKVAGQQVEETLLELGGPTPSYEFTVPQRITIGGEQKLVAPEDPGWIARTSYKRPSYEFTVPQRITIGGEQKFKVPEVRGSYYGDVAKVAGFGTEIGAMSLIPGPILSGGLIFSGAEQYKKGNKLGGVLTVGTGLLLGGSELYKGYKGLTRYKFDRISRPTPEVTEYSRALNKMSPESILIKSKQGEFLVASFKGGARSVTPVAGSDIVVMQSRIRKILGMKPKFVSEPRAIINGIKYTRPEYLKGYKKALEVLQKDYGLSLNQAKQFIRNTRPEIKVATAKYSGEVISTSKDPLKIDFKGTKAEFSPGLTIERKSTLGDISYPLKSRNLKLSRIKSNFDEAFSKAIKKQEVTGYGGLSSEFEPLGTLGKRGREFKEATVVKKVGGVADEGLGVDLTTYKADTLSREVTYSRPKRLSSSSSDISVLTKRPEKLTTLDYLKGEKTTQVFKGDKSTLVTEPLGIKIKTPKPKIERLSKSQIDEAIKGKANQIVKDLQNIYGETTKQALAESSAKIIKPPKVKVPKTQLDEVLNIESKATPRVTIKGASAETSSLTSQSMFTGTGQYERTQGTQDTLSINKTTTDLDSSLSLTPIEIGRTKVSPTLGVKSSQRDKITEDISQIQQSKLDSKLKVSQASRSAQETSQQTRVTVKVSPRVTTPKPRTPKKGTEVVFPFSSSKIKKKGTKKTRTKKERFLAITKRRGKEVVLGITETPTQAERIAKTSVLTTLGATAKVRTTTGKKVRLTPDKIFRPSKTDPLALVQRKTGGGGRLASLGERKEIKQSRRVNFL